MKTSLFILSHQKTNRRRLGGTQRLTNIFVFLHKKFRQSTTLGGNDCATFAASTRKSCKSLVYDLGPLWSRSRNAENTDILNRDCSWLAYRCLGLFTFFERPVQCICSHFGTFHSICIFWINSRANQSLIQYVCGLASREKSKRKLVIKAAKFSKFMSKLSAIIREYSFTHNGSSAV